MIVNINENGLFLQFYVDCNKRLSLFNFSTKEEKLPQNFKDENGLYAVTEVGVTGIIPTGTKKHISYVSPNFPQYVCHNDTYNEYGRLIEFVLKSEMLEIRQYYQFYDGIRTVSSYAKVKNISNENIGLEYVSSFALTGFGADGDKIALDDVEFYIPHNSWCEELNWRRQTLREAGIGYKNLHASTKRICISNTGNHATKEYLPMGILHDKRRNASLFWQIESNSSWSYEIGDLFQKLYLRISGPNEMDNLWWKELTPGEDFTTLTAAVSCVDGGFDEAVRQMTEYRRKTILNGRVDNNLSVIFNDYMDCLWADPTTEKVLPLIEKAAELGAEIYCMDAGWYSKGYWWDLVGEWQVCEERFTGGMKQIFESIKAHGMKAGIWIEPEVMGVKCPLVPKFEDCFFKRHGKNIDSKGRYQLDFRNKKVRDHLDKIVDGLVKEYDIDFFKFDYNIDPILGTEVDADSFGDGLLKANEAYLEWVDGVLGRHPHLQIENCDSGGMRMDYRSLKHFSLQSVSDATHYNEFAHMGVMASTAVIPEQAAIWVVNTTKNTPEQNAFACVNALLSRMCIGGKIDEFSDKQFENLKNAVACYKSIREDIKGGIPYFPLGVRNAENSWFSGGLLSGDKERFYLTVSRLTGGEEEITIPLDLPFAKPKNAKIIYPENVGEFELFENAIKVKLQENSAVLIKIEA